MTADIEKLRFTLESMSKAATDLIQTDGDKIDVSWMSAFVAAIETTLEAIGDWNDPQRNNQIHAVAH